MDRRNRTQQAHCRIAREGAHFALPYFAALFFALPYFALPYFALLAATVDVLSKRTVEVAARVAMKYGSGVPENGTAGAAAQKIGSI